VSAAPLHPGEKLARAALRRYGLPAGQPPKDLLGTIEAKVHVPVLVDRFNDGEIAGVLLRHADEESFIAINADHLPVRQRFTLAHEWGHVEAGHTPRVERSAELFGGGSKDPQEAEANYFAAELLAPRDALVQWLTEHKSTSDVDAAAAAQIAMHFGIAFPAACYRLQRAGVIDEARKRALVSTLKVEGRSYAQRFEGSRHLDALEELAAKGSYPRVPEVMKGYASRALEFDLIDQEEYDEMMSARDRLDAWFA
jgi:Zn-dependent peptidase ImmA (M78 family)